MSLSTHQHESCWTDEYSIAHSECYGVEDEHGERVGVVDRVVWPDEPFAAATAVVVRLTRRRGRVVIPVDVVRDVDPSRARLVVPASALSCSRVLEPRTVDD